MDKAISVVIAEDYTFIRKGIRALLDVTRDIQVVGEASNGFETVELVIEKKPDVLILDISMPRMDGIEVIEHLKQSGSKTHILIHTIESDPVYLRSLYDLGVDGVLPKGCNPETLINTVRRMAGADAFKYQHSLPRSNRMIPSA